MAQRKAYPLRLDPAIYEALQRWADSELRSLNGQIDFVLRRALQEAGRLPARATDTEEANDGTQNESDA